LAWIASLARNDVGDDSTSKQHAVAPLRLPPESTLDPTFEAGGAPRALGPSVTGNVVVAHDCVSDDLPPVEAARRVSP